MPRGQGGGGFGRGGRRGLGGGFGFGPGGECICPNCNHREAHIRGVPCYSRKCPKCGTPMARPV
jgi:electron transport complex protein RnfB